MAEKIFSLLSRLRPSQNFLRTWIWRSGARFLLTAQYIDAIFWKRLKYRGSHFWFCLFRPICFSKTAKFIQLVSNVHGVHSRDKQWLTPVSNILFVSQIIGTNQRERGYLLQIYHHLSWASKNNRWGFQRKSISKKRFYHVTFDSEKISENRLHRRFSERILVPKNTTFTWTATILREVTITLS